VPLRGGTDEVPTAKNIMVDWLLSGGIGRGGGHDVTLDLSKPRE